jgi:hypothetical protein
LLLVLASTVILGFYIGKVSLEASRGISVVFDLPFKLGGSRKNVETCRWGSGD